MELRLLRYFVTVAQLGTVSAAAATLHVTQPGLSRQLRQFERSLGVTLFDREGGRLALSSAGRGLLPAARDLLDRSDAFLVLADLHSAGRIEQFTVGAPTATLTDIVAPFIATLGPADPRADVRSTDGVRIQTVLTEGADLAIGTARPPKPFTSTPLAVVPVWAYVGASHPWADRDVVSLKQLIEQSLISLPPAFTARRALDEALTSQNLEMPNILEAANGTVAQALAAAGRGVAVVSDDPRYDLIPLAVDVGAGERLSIGLMTAWDSRHAASVTLEAMAGRLSAFVCERYGTTPTHLVQSQRP